MLGPDRFVHCEYDCPDRDAEAAVFCSNGTSASWKAAGEIRIEAEACAAEGQAAGRIPLAHEDKESRVCANRFCEAGRPSAFGLAAVVAYCSRPEDEKSVCVARLTTVALDSPKGL